MCHQCTPPSALVDQYVLHGREYPVRQLTRAPHIQGPILQLPAGRSKPTLFVEFSGGAPGCNEKTMGLVLVLTAALEGHVPLERRCGVEVNQYLGFPSESSTGESRTTGSLSKATKWHQAGGPSVPRNGLALCARVSRRSGNLAIPPNTPRPLRCTRCMAGLQGVQSIALVAVVAGCSGWVKR
jgi:hypothetical protein